MVFDSRCWDERSDARWMLVGREGGMFREENDAERKETVGEFWVHVQPVDQAGRPDRQHAVMTWDIGGSE